MREGMKIWDPLRKKDVALTPEESVRQWFISLLLVKCHVPAHFMMSEVSMTFGHKRYRADILVYGKDLKPLMAVECKREGVELDQDVIDQVLRYNMALNVKYLAITNGIKTFIFMRDGEGYVPLDEIPDFKDMSK